MHMMIIMIAIMFWIFLIASCRGEETVCVKFLKMSIKTFTVCTH